MKKHNRHILYREFILAFLFLCGTVTLKAQIDIQTKEKRDRFEILYDILQDGFNKPKSDSLRSLMDEALDIALYLNNDTLIARSYNFLGGYFDGVGNYERSLEYLYKAIEASKRSGDIRSRIMMLNNIAWAHTQAYNYEKGRDICLEGIALLDSLNDPEIANSVSSFIFNNLAISLTELGELDKALTANLNAQKANEIVHSPVMGGWILGQFGRIFEEKKNIEKAESYYKGCIEYSDSIDHQFSLVYGSVYYARMLNDHSRHREALKIGHLALNVGTEIQYNRYLIDAAKELRIAYAELGFADSAYHYAQTEISIRDSLFSAQKSQQMNDLVFGREIEKKEEQHKLEVLKKNNEIERQRIVRNTLIGGFLLLAIFAFLVLIQRNRISRERKRSEELLLNILPKEVAEELKEKGEAEAQLIEKVTVLFTDFKGFTAMSEILSPKDLVKDLDLCFSEFDKITSKYGIEKIKTIGDAYMAAGGLPTPNTTHATDVIKAALEMRDFVEAGKAKKIQAGLPYFEVRIGIHTGPVVAGIVGVKKFQYDIWGDTVNTASRMESSGQIGQVNISEATYELVKENSEFNFSSRGKIKAKGKGELEMYFVKLN
ncbi:MAG: hypothetical protein HKN39_04185 [Flavobacteriales bacterium]|nr:hypothetical protein [Flavobacteriales bacterium]